MAGAVGVALRRLDAAIDEILTRRIAERPSAGAFLDILQSHSQHLSDLGLGKEPCRLPFAREGRDDRPLPQSRIRATDRRPPRPPRGCPRRSGRRAVGIAGELDPEPVRLADHGVARRRAERRGDAARAFSFERQLSQSLRLPPRSTCPMPSLLLWQFKLLKNVASPAPQGRRDADPHTLQHRHRMPLRLYFMVNTTFRCE